MSTHKYQTWVCRCFWDSTAYNILIYNAKNEIDAWDKAWKRIARTEGGDHCKDIKVLRIIE